MAGIVSYGAHIPVTRIGPDTKGWDSTIEKAVAYYDEDSLTMAVSAAIDCLGNIDRRAVDGLFFASTTSPYSEKLISTTIATAIDLRDDIITHDCTNSLRSGTGALRLALDSVKAGSVNQVLVTAADCRIAIPRGSFDLSFGDGAASFMVGNTNVIATIEGSYSISDEMLDIWRISTSKYVRSWEERFVYDEGYNRVFPLVVKGLLDKCQLKPGDITKAVLYGPDRRRHAAMAKMLGFQPTQIQDPLFGKLGNTGTAFSLMLLVAALEDAKPGDKILCASYGNGADALLLKVTDEIVKVKNKRAIKYNLGTKMMLDNFDSYLSYRHQAFADAEPQLPFRPSASCIWRERDSIYRLYGSKCKTCGTIQYPPQRVCTKCRAKDNFDNIRLSDKKGNLFTYSLDIMAAVPRFDLPMVDAVIDFEGGGRGNFMMTDKNPMEIKVGMEVEMTFRKLHTAQGIHNYYWKCMPVRDSKQTKGEN